MSWEFKSPHPHKGLMILLSINNSSEIVAKKAGKFIESLTPAGFDEAKVEEEVIKKLIQNLVAEGIHGQIAAVRGLHLLEKELRLDDKMQVRRHDHF
ncbi:MAG: hypothetical protein ACKOOH_06210 [Cyanobium sp.]